MATFAAHVFVHGESGPVHFAPGDELPGWAEDLVGKHCLAPEAEAEEPSFTAGDSGEADDTGEPDSEGQEDEADDEDETPPPVGEQPDFTAPAPARRGRSRKP